MEPILTKQEIADLLTAIRQGKIPTDIESEDGVPAGKTAKPLNLFQISALDDEQARIPNFDIILDAFCQNYSISLTNQLQRTFAFSKTGIETHQFQEFLLENKDMGAIGVLNLAPLKYGALIMVDKQLSFSMIEIMLGASTDQGPLQLNRKLTTIELSVLKTIMAIACSDLDRAFNPLIDLQSSVLKVESNSRLVSITSADAEILVSRFTVTIGEISGEFKLVFPIATLDPLREQFKELVSVNKSKQGQWTDIFIEELYDMETTVIAQSGTISLTINQLLDLKEGEIINLDYDPNSPLKVLVEDKLKFFAIPGVLNGKKAISLTGVYEQGA
ncbi:MAG: FliM/FliN family flagellar motor switch protein [Desulfocapsaceae bacterium]|nr:FliM/FliN family flagellar motor switch protein [Desulfocapsaceae bacterium]